MKRTLFFSTLLLASMIACYKDDAEFLFDEYGNINSGKTKRWKATANQYVHANMGWGSQGINDYWVERGAYNFGATNYNGKIYFVANIRPN